MPNGLRTIVDKYATSLILGSFPGPLSLDLKQYYAHPRNLFWRIMASLFNFDSEADYGLRTKNLKKGRIAVWDVLETCERIGAADARIRNPVANDFEKFFRKYPNVKKVIFNGRQAEQLFGTLVLGRQWLPELTCIYAPSTSPANARMNFEAKLNAWQASLE